jgi:uncharacterized protein YprB with RNaseH-like and TPR domain
MESLSDKLKSLGVHFGANKLPSSKPARNEYPIEEVIQGVDFQTPLGNAFMVEQFLPLDYRQGTGSLFLNNISLDVLARWAQRPHISLKRPDKFIFLDTETSGLSGGTGTFVFMIGLGFQSDAGFRLVQLFMRDPSQEMAFLAALNHFINSFEVVVTFNGKAFDIPLLNTRHILNGFSSPFKEMDHIDILPLARRIWRNRLSNRALSNLEIEILGVERTQVEVPGWMIPELYFEYLRTGDARPLAGIFYHNANDILSLAGLFYYLAKMLGDPSGDPALPGMDIAALARLYEELEDWITAIQLYERSLEQGLPRDFYIQTLSRFASLYRRQGNWDGAIYLWKKAAEQQQIEAYIELAKYYEHNQRDYIEAIKWTQNALELALKTEINPFERRNLMVELNKRLERLSNKQNKAGLT